MDGMDVGPVRAGAEQWPSQPVRLAVAPKLVSPMDDFSRQSTTATEGDIFELAPVKVVYSGGRTTLTHSCCDEHTDDSTPHSVELPEMGLVSTPEASLEPPPGLALRAFATDCEDTGPRAACWKPLPKDYRHRQVPRRLDFEAGYKVRQAILQDDQPTTLMIRNIPNRYAQMELMAELEDLGFAGTFDFFYLPMDPGRRRKSSDIAMTKPNASNVGYAFVNFVDAFWAAKCMVVLDGYGFKLHRKVSKKVASVSIAHLQGLEANRQHYANSSVRTAVVAGSTPWESTTIPFWEPLLGVGPDGGAMLGLPGPLSMPAAWAACEEAVAPR